MRTINPKDPSRWDSFEALRQSHHPRRHHAPDAAAPSRDRSALGTPQAPSAMFDHARFGGVEKDAQGGLTAHIGMGMDLAGTIHVDAQGQITFDQHVVSMHTGAARPLSAADRASLAANLKKYLGTAGAGADPLWGEVLQAASRPG